MCVVVFGLCRSTCVTNLRVERLFLPVVFGVSVGQAIFVNLGHRDKCSEYVLFNKGRDGFCAGTVRFARAQEERSHLGKVSVARLFLPPPSLSPGKHPHSCFVAARTSRNEYR